MRGETNRSVWHAGLLLVAAFLANTGAGHAQTGVVETTICRDYFMVQFTSTKREGGEALSLLYDTGASFTAIDPDALARFTGDRLPAGKRVRIRNLKTGDVTVDGLRARLVELDHLSTALGQELDGILAYDAFGKLLVTLDYPADEMRVSTGALPPPDGQTRFSTKGRDKRPWLRVDFAGRERLVLIDSGANSSFSVNDIDTYPTVEPPTLARASTRFRTMEYRKAARLDGEASFGAITVDKPILAEVPGSELLGSEIMLPFAVTFDVVRKRVAFEGDPNVSIPTEPVRSTGMLSRSESDGMTVVKVLDDSPAAMAGVVPGDKIVAINGKAPRARGCDPRNQGGPSRYDIVSEDGTRREIELRAVTLVE